MYEVSWGEARQARTCEWRCQFEGNNNNKLSKPHRRNLRYSLFAHGNTCSTLLYFIIFLFEFQFVSEFDSSPTHTVGQVVCARFKLCCAIMIRTVCLATTQSSHTQTHTSKSCVGISYIYNIRRYESVFELRQIKHQLNEESGENSWEFRKREN